MRRLIATLTLVTVVAAACGGSSNPSSDTTAVPTPSAAPSAAATAGAEPPPSPSAGPANPAPPESATTAGRPTPAEVPDPRTATPAEVPDPRTATTAPSFPAGVEPARIEIPAIGVDAGVVELDLAGPAPEVPTDFGQAGWYVQTREPGEIGPAVIAGHVDSARGPAVFFRLHELTEGDEIVIGDGDGGTRTFAVTGSARYRKDALAPEVFGFGEPHPELRLITCGGSFDPTSGHYRDNVVVFARLIA